MAGRYKFPEGDFLHKAQTTTGDSIELNVENVDMLTIQIFGTASTFTLEFKCSLDGTNYVPLEGRDKGDSSIVTNKTSTLGRIWTFDVRDLIYFKTTLTSPIGGNVTVLANGAYVD